MFFIFLALALAILGLPVAVSYIALQWHRANLAHQLDQAKHAELTREKGHKRFLELDLHHAGLEEPAEMKTARLATQRANAEAQAAEAKAKSTRAELELWQLKRRY